MSSARFWLAVIIVALAGGCRAPAATVEDPAMFEVDVAARSSGARTADEKPAGSTAPSAPRPAQVGYVRRSQLHRVLDAGLPAFLGTLEVRAHVVGGRFAGWEVIRFDNQWIDLRPGDVVTSVNGRSIERPSQAQALWEDLRTATDIEVCGYRAGKPFELSFEVTGEPAAPAP